MTLRNPEVQSVSAFFPCYNDEHSISMMVRAAGAALIESVDDFEIIVVDDGSSDGSVAALEMLLPEVPELTITRHLINRGYGGALISGFAESTKQWVFYTDGDAQYDASEVLRCIDAVRPDTDVVQGWKIKRGDRWYRRVIGRGYHHTVRLLFNLHVRDTDCDFRLIRATVMDRIQLRSTSGVICVEMMRKFEQANANFVEVGVSHRPRPYGRSQFFRVAAIAKSARQLIALWWRLVVRRDRVKLSRTQRRKDRLRPRAAVASSILKQGTTSEGESQAEALPELPHIPGIDAVRAPTRVFTVKN